ncbi:TAP42-like protein [Mycena alexandri]|uniref:TAP42-like protein n=1 Tax=Mycena alexandri TaxID=1745969 RepID=A0AAD6XCB7_9AGAR|nr:TAP42-like protein [Mycena alexandri]
MSISLPVLFSRCLQDASKAFNGSAFEQSTQDLIQSSLTDLKSLSARILGLSLFSPNEILEDISTRDLIYLLVPYALAEVQGRVRAIGNDERIVFLKQSQNYISTFISHLENYEIIPESERTLHAQDPTKIKDPASRRELKIKQYQREKDLRARIETIRKRRGQLPVEGEMESDFDLISSLLPKRVEDEDEEEDSESEDVLRETILLLLRLCYVQSQSQLQSLAQELELLQNAPRMPPPPPSRPEDDRRGKERATETDMWKLDAPRGADGKGPLLDPDGKPLRPFTILPSGTSDRARMAAQVFGPGHRLPTMSIDEYLQIEQERGNILTGGGPASENALTSSEQLAVDSEMDGSRNGAEKEEMKRLKDENWAQFTDENPRGAGNTMNRG